MFNTIPWKKALSELARKHEFIDPIEIMARLENFAKPSEIREPVELLRAGAAFHARGLMNTKAIQHNLDWIWPFWVNRQFDPSCASFLPRAFSITHVNLTHRNWTAVGIPGCQALPIVDPCGLVTPHYDGWSIDAWVICENGQKLISSRQLPRSQRLVLREDDLCVDTIHHHEAIKLESHVNVRLTKNSPRCRIAVNAEAGNDAWLVVSLRPCNPEGVSFVHSISLDKQNNHWMIDDAPCVYFSAAVEKHKLSDYDRGDVALNILELEESHAVNCRVGMATAAAMFRVKPGKPRNIQVEVDLRQDKASQPMFPIVGGNLSWQATLHGTCRLQIPDDRIQFLFDAAVRTIILHSPKDVYPGPFTYKRFWFRDTTFIVYAMLCAGLIKRAERTIDDFRSRQKANGYFHSQDGEWDSNGQVINIVSSREQNQNASG
jgi:hypothetical protein